MSLNNKTDYSIYNFLDEHIVEKGKIYSHTSMGKPTGSFFIKENELDEFYSLYQDAIFNGKKLHITEKHDDICPIIIDLDFKYEHEIIKRQHTEETIKKIVNIYNEIILSILDIEPGDERLQAFVFERNDVYHVKAITKDGIHILYPNIITSPEVQYYIRECVLKKIVPILEELPLTNKPYDVVDRSVIKDTNWLLYGCSKPNIDPYHLKFIYNGKLEEIGINDYQFNKNIAHFFSIRHKSEDEVIATREDKKYLIENISLKKKNIRISKRNIIVDDYEEIIKLVSILNDERTENYSDWISLGWLLYNIDPNSQELLDLWIDFSRRSSKFKEGTCEKEWNKSKNDGIRLGLPTLHYWAKNDNLEKYEQILLNSLNKLVEKSIKTPTHCDIANVVYKKYEYEFKYSGDEWYKYENNIWVKEKDGISLRSKISSESKKSNGVVEIYIKIISDFNKIITSFDPNITDEDKEECKTKNKEVLEIIKKLKTTSFKDNIMKECREKFYDKSFVNKLDTNNYLMAFKNGVYDLQTGELRDGRPDDYIEMNTGIDKIDFEESNEYYKELQKFIDTIFIDKEVREYFMLYLASCLQGHNAEEKFRIWTGNGCHALDTPIMMFDGTTKMVQDINVNDKLMGDDSLERNVLELKRGFSQMYEITTIKNEKFTVNGDHILSLMATNIGGFVNCKKEYRYKLLWQEKDDNGIPINKSKNFAYKHENRVQYKKNTIYYENEEDAFNNGLIFKNNLSDNKNIIKKGDIIDISLNNYLKIKDKIGNRNYFLYKTGVNFNKQEVPLDPYILGYWLGDGTSSLSAITTMDEEIVDYFNEYSIKNNLNIKKYNKNNNNKASTYIYSSKSRKHNLYENNLYESLKNLNLINNKHIPVIYQKNDRNTQLNILAGLIDSDGHYQKNSKQYEITLKNKNIIDGIIFIGRSLGFSVTIRNVKKTIKNELKECIFEGDYINLIIYGDNLSDIPVKLDRKKAVQRNKNKNCNMYSFTINQVEDNNFYGFELDKNHRYLMSDFTVTHNSNGKSKLIELFVSCMGEYSIKFPITLLTGKRASSNACSPELVVAKGKRFGYFEEPSENERINAGLMKEFTGGDKVYARGLHKDPIEFKPQWKLALLCNDIPEVPPHDNGTWRRMEIIEFKSRFCENPKEDHEFAIDKKLSEKLNGWKELFMSLLIDKYYVLYKKHGINVPNEVVKFTLEFQKQCDIYTDFLSEKLDQTKDMSDILEISLTYDEFKVWYEETFSHHKYPSKVEFKKYLTKKYGKKIITANGIKGFKFKDCVNEKFKSSLSNIDIGY